MTETTNTTTVQIFVELDELIYSHGSYDLIWERADIAVRRITGDEDATLVDLTITPERVDGESIVLTVTGYVESL